MQRVMICGGSGSGKSTLARALGQRTGLPVFHMDQIHWKSGWVERDQDERRDMVRAIVAKDAWIFEGNHSRTHQERLARADTLIWLDLPIVLRQWRVFVRMLKTYGQTRPDLPAGCPERFDRGTLAFWAFIWRTRHSVRARLAAIAADPGHIRIHHLASRAQIRAFIDTIPTKSEPFP